MKFNLAIITNFSKQVRRVSRRRCLHTVTIQDQACNIRPSCLAIACAFWSTWNSGGHPWRTQGVIPGELTGSTLGNSRGQPWGAQRVYLAKIENSAARGQSRTAQAQLHNRPGSLHRDFGLRDQWLAPSTSGQLSQALQGVHKTFACQIVST